MSLSSKYPYVKICRTKPKYVFLLTRAFEVRTVIVSWIYGSKNYVTFGNLIS